MDKRKGYVLLLINAGVRSSVSERKKSLHFGKHNKGDKSYKFMLQVANFHR